MTENPGVTDAGGPLMCLAGVFGTCIHSSIHSCGGRADITSHLDSPEAKRCDNLERYRTAKTHEEGSASFCDVQQEFEGGAEIFFLFAQSCNSLSRGTVLRVPQWVIMAQFQTLLQE